MILVVYLNSTLHIQGNFYEVSYNLHPENVAIMSHHLRHLACAHSFQFNETSWHIVAPPFNPPLNHFHSFLYASTYACEYPFSYQKRHIPAHMHIKGPSW